MIEYPNILNKIFDKLKKNNAKVIIVGGYIRDSLLNIPSDDIDIEVYNISSFKKLENILKEFGDVNSVGKSFGVCKLKYENLFLDFTLPRIDSKIASGHQGFDIKIQKNLDFKSAALRRDFSMNAIGYDIDKKELLDPFNGVNDLNSRSLKMVDAQSFIDDPLRVLRAVQFCARYNLKMDNELFLQCLNMIKQNILLELPKERIYTEIQKLFIKAKKPSIGFELLKKFGASSCIPSLDEEKWSILMRALDSIATQKITNEKTKEVLMLASLCYNYSSKITINFITNLSNDKKILNRVLVLLKNVKIIKNLSTNATDDYQIYKLSTQVNIQELSILSKALYKTGDKIALRAKELDVLNTKIPAILQGRDLIAFGMKPSNKFSTILDAAYDAQMRKKFDSYDGAVIWFKNYMD